MHAFTNLSMNESTLTSKCQTTLPKSVRKALGVKPGDRLRYVILQNNEVRILPEKPVMRLFGSVRYDGEAVSLKQMQEAVARGASEQ